MSACSLIIRDGEAAEDGEAAGGVQRGGLGAAQAAPRAALVALLVRQGVGRAGWRLEHLRGHGSKIVRRACWRGRRGGVGLGAYRAGAEAGPKQVGQLLAGVGERVTAGPVGHLVGEEHGRRRDRRGAVSQPRRAGEAGEAVAVLQPRPLHLVGGVEGGRLLGGPAALVGVVDEMAAGPVGAESDGVEGAAQLRFVLGVAAQAAEFVDPVSELALVAVLAGAVLLEGPAQLRLVAAGVDLAAAAAAAAAGGAGGAQALVDEPLARLGEGAVPQAVLLVVAGVANP